MSRLTKRWLIIGASITTLIVLALLWLFFTSSGARFVLNRVPGLNAESVVGQLWGDTELKAVVYSSQGLEAEMQTLSIQWRPQALFASGRLEIDELSVSGLKITTSASQTTDQADTASEQPFTSPLPVYVQRALFTDINWFESGTSKFEVNRLDVFGLALTESQLKIEKSTAVSNSDSVSVSGQLDLAFSDAGEIDLSLNHSIVDMLSGDGALDEALESPLDGTLVVGGTWSRLQVEHTLAKPWSISTSATLSDALSGSLLWKITSRFDNTLLPQANGLRFKGVIESSGALQSSNILKGLSIGVTGELSGQNVSQPLDIALEYADKQLTVTNAKLGADENSLFDISGSISNINDAKQLLNVDLTATWGALDILGNMLNLELPPAQGTASVTGQEQAFELHLRSKVDTKTDEGAGTGADIDIEIIGQGDSESLSLSHLGISGNNIELSGKLDLTAQQQSYTAKLTHLAGQFHGQAITGKGALLYSSNELDVTELAINAGASKLDVHGRLGAAASDLKWSIKIPDFSLLNANTRGSLIASGDITGSLGSPNVNARIDAKKLNLDTINVESLNGNVQLGTASTSPVVAALNASNVSIGREEWISQLDIDLSGTVARHELLMTSHFNGGALNELNGGGAYDGREFIFDLKTNDFPAQATRIFTRTQAYDIDGMIDFAAKGRYSAIDGLVLESELGADTLTVISKDQQRADIQFSNIFAQVSSTNKETTLSAKTKINNSGNFDASASIAAPLLSDSFSQAAIQGKLALNYPDLESFATLLPNDVEISGTLDVSAGISGTLSKPDVSTQSRISQGSFKLLSQGLALDNLNLAIEANDTTTAKTSITGSADAGQGRIQVNGELDLTNQAPELALNFTADNALLLNTPQIKAEANTELALSINSDAVTLTGNAKINSADINVGLVPGVIQESPDLILEGIERDNTPIKVLMDLDVDFGTQTAISAAGLTGRLVGKPRISIKQDGLLSSVGEIQLVGGKFSILGEELSVDKGVASYAGGDISNPRLSVEATKTLSNVRAGLMIEGNADSPDISLFSQPTYSDQDVLALVFFEKTLDQLSSTDAFKLISIANALRGGRINSSRFDAIQDSVANYLGVDKLDVSVDTDNGQRKISLATKINSKLDVGYAYNFVSSLQALFLRYRLNDQWAIQSSVDVESGADIVYKAQR